MTREEELGLDLQKARDGNRHAFEAFAGRLRGRLEAFTRSRLRPHLLKRLELDDLVQETFLRAYQSLDRFEGKDDDAFFRWLTGIAKHVVLKALEGLRREGALRIARPGPSRRSSPSVHMRRDERFERLQQAVDGLKSDHREAILLCRIEGLSIEEVARRMNRSPGAVKKLLWRALKELRKSFGDTESLHLPDRRLGPLGGDDAG